LVRLPGAADETGFGELGHLFGSARQAARGR